MAANTRRSCSEVLKVHTNLGTLAPSRFDCRLVLYNDLLIEDLLDKGQYGSVYKGIWQGVSIAIKELDDCTDPKEFSDEGGSLYRVLHVEKRQLDPDSVTSLLTDIAKGLSYLHAQNVIHRDLKSKNVLLTKEPLRAKLCDFGVSKLQAKDSTQTDDVGTLLWMAPEVVRSRCHSEGSDVYSYGAVIYEVLTNSLPFSDTKELNHYNIMYLMCMEAKRLTLPECVLPKTPLQIKYIIDRCLDHSVDMRPPASDLVELLGGVDWEETCSLGSDTLSDDMDAFDDEGV
ncbi:Protein kinase [Oopsacas minuta]|uniref:Protein kinase n=1 Tax=Oopsacas minuta TaxID=111878 RepID=A0AAV7K6A2_9METZ|nr:Protein kinase [Oopsacas minuta]